MFARCVRELLLLCAGAVLIGCSNPQGLDFVRVSPTAQSLAVGQTAQLTVTGTYGNANHPSTQLLTSGVNWSSTAPSVATVSSSGVVTGVNAGSTTITASATAFNGPVSSSATITVTGAGGGSTAGGHLLSLTIVPSSITVGNLQDTGQFLAIGTFSTSPFVQDLTNSPSLTWISSTPSVFPVNTNSGGTPGATAGIVTAYGVGSGTIIAEAKSSDGTIQTATATFTCPAPDNPPKPGQCFEGSQAPALLATLTIYNEGLNTTNWLVTAPSATGTPNVINCHPGTGSVCVATYPMGAKVVLTASGGAFGGWSYNCIPSDKNGNTANPPPITAAGPNYCTITFSPPSNTVPANSNVTVGAIFN